MKKDFIENIYYIIDEDIVFKNYFNNKDLLKKILKDKETFNYMYEKFTYEFNNFFEKDDLFMKTEDFVFRLDLLINKILIPNGYTKIEDIRKVITENNFDLYSTINYEFNEEVLEDFMSELNKDGVKI